MSCCFFFILFCVFCFFFFFFNDTATTEIYTLSLHDALPSSGVSISARTWLVFTRSPMSACHARTKPLARRSEEHTSELQSRLHLVCRLLLEKKKKNNKRQNSKKKKKKKLHKQQ